VSDISIAELAPIRSEGTSDSVIRADGLGKKYTIRHTGEGYATLREVIVRGASNFCRKAAGIARGNLIVADNAVEEFWALRDITFEVKQGEVLGIIGRNGAGKSTLLKILSRITEPTEGRVTINGRVASLLEVGTGFHPELTGRENVYLNGAILGMTNAEIRRKFDEIVAFAEVEKFLDTPVKRYSSGMYVRLAFAVAAHLDPEILIVDEVLSVGDAEFQKKSLGKISQVATAGRTVLFVSHNMAAVEALCTRAILLKSGRLSSSGRPHDQVTAYLVGRPTSSLADRTDRQGSQIIKFISVAIYPSGGKPGDPVILGTDIVFELVLENYSQMTHNKLDLCIGIYDVRGRAITFLENAPVHTTLNAAPGPSEFRCTIQRAPFMPGEYVVNINCFEDGQPLDWIQNATSFIVHPGNYYGTGKLPCTELGGVCVDYSWS
jgi:lipopolysaccharide transport system ATP-binding protein